MQSTLPKLGPINVAIIMDGNGRWAIQRGLPRTAGHSAGVATLRDVVETALTLNLQSMTVYAFSSDNWTRPAREVSALMRLLRRYLARELAHLVENGVRLTVIGRRDRLPYDIVAQIEHAEAVTRHGTRLHLRIAFDYSSRQAILDAARQHSDNTLSEDEMSRALASQNGPSSIDFLIRTGGEQRLSDFLLWEAAYAELYFSDVLWPDFDGNALITALQAFHKRNRRFGGLPGFQERDAHPVTDITVKTNTHHPGVLVSHRDQVHQPHAKNRNQTGSDQFNSLNAKQSA